MQIRLLKKEDIKKAGEIVALNYNKEDANSCISEMRDMFRTSAIKPQYFVAEVNGIIVGIIGFMQSAIDYAIYQIFWVNVHPDYQGKGIGQKLVGKAIIQIKKDKGAKVIILSATKLNFYKKHFNFKKIDMFTGRSNKHYIMSLKIR